ncbi:hypothetical protein [Mucilaginibacter sp.]|uniref:hypothetical protein n=1 Tax=Mucilaginibacter sp. TaxID=1882438 RepID=UPI00261125A3|nr:hypothetical protein [Mucilaginibacter sp.]MDB4924606.1 hypothetical protein [Mucilaginibacter sp.]
MRKVLIVCLLACGINTASKAQCPINEIITTKEPQVIASLIDNNTDCIKQSLLQNPEYQSFRVYIDYLYNTSSPWVYHTNPEKEKLFVDFYTKWGEAYPTMRSPAPTDENFYTDLKAMIATDPGFFAQQKVTKIPVKYQQWLYVKKLNKKYGERNIELLTNAAAKIANLSTTNYSAFVSSY